MGETLGLILGSVAVGALVSSVVNGFFQHRISVARMAHEKHMKAVELKQDRMRTALELSRLKNEQVIEAARNMPGRPVELWDPAASVAVYLKALEEIDRTGVWVAGQEKKLK